MKNTMLDMPRYAALARQAVAEGVVLLKNEAVLPLAPGGRAALFGYAQFHYYKSGTGSGGLVNTAPVPALPEVLGGPGGYHLDAEVQARYAEWLANHPYEMGTGWAQEPWFQPEMPLDEDFVRAAARRTETAFIVIGRTAGEDQDNSNTPGSFLLTEGEENMLALVCRHFKKSVVLLNVGNIMDMQWVTRYEPGAVAYIWQGGQEGCRGVLDVLNGTASPSGKLPDTIARTPADYPAAGHYGADDRNFYAEDIYVGYRYFETFAPEKVLYPFGFGLSYSKFDVKLLSSDENADGITAFAAVKNIGGCPGKEVVQLYCTAPQGRLGKPAKVLCAFAKTGTLAPGESQTLRLTAPWRNFASYDDSGVTGHKSAFVLEAGDYRFSLGTDVRSAAAAFTVTLPLTVVEQLESVAAPAEVFDRLRPGADGFPAWEPVPTERELPETRRAAHLPKEYPQTGDKGLRLKDVADGTATMADFVAQFSDDELCTIVRGEGMNSPRVTPGTAGAIGGVSDALQHYGLPAACCSDGPSGIRMDCGTVAFSMPNGTCLAATFNEELSEALYSMEGLELRKNHVDTLLGPGINIHRHPLNGRNFEYFSEDPLLTGRMACAQLRGLHRWGVTGTIKHFAANNQEHRRHFVESVVSERALREIYLRAFELAVREGQARSIMTSYNPVNGYWTASHYDLVTTILRGQWGYTGLVMSDWWAEGNDRGGHGSTRHVAAMVRAQNDV
ncbi:MAG: glycoside hydrolase family 3 protein, partial [Gemmiger sp.]